MYPEQYPSAYHTLNNFVVHKDSECQIFPASQKAEKDTKQKKSSCETSNSFSEWTEEFSLSVSVYFLSP